MTAPPTNPTRIRRLRPALTAATIAILCVAALAPAAALAAVPQPGPVAGDGGAAAAASATVVQRPCFGAAARNPIATCLNPSLRLTVFPTPDDAVLQPNAPCQPLALANLLNPCSFGASDAAGQASIALIGDSHAAHWRAAVDVVAQREGWRGISITRSGCPFSIARVVITPRERAAGCARWNRELVAWLGSHPEVTTIFVSQRANAAYHPDGGAGGNFDVAVRGDAALWRALPATIRHIMVIRDTPLESSVADECVRRAVAHRQSVGIRCARARAKALAADPAVTAARQLRGRVHVLDMTRFFCSSAVCYPVVGGALVHKDADHITTVFARTLGPFMASKVATIVNGRNPS